MHMVQNAPGVAIPLFVHRPAIPIITCPGEALQRLE